jgi:hypothetical protein
MAGLLRDINLSPTEQVTSRHAASQSACRFGKKTLAIWLGWVSMSGFDVPLAQ